MLHTVKKTVFSSTEINIVTPAFVGNSFLSHLVPTPSSSEFNYSLALLTTQESSGLVLYMSSPDSYVALGLESGTLVLYVGTDSGPVQLRAESESALHLVEIHVNTQEASLWVDGQVERVGIAISSPVTEADSVVYVGGVPDFSLLSDDVAQMTGLVGCVHDREANGQSVELNVVAHEGRSILQCPHSVCPYVHCQNGAECNETSQFPGFTCNCLPFFSGVFCETALPVCDPNPCLFGGVCRDENFTFSCQCPLGRGGRTCEEGELYYQ